MGSKEFIKKIVDEFNENKNSHVFLIETNDINNCIVDVKSIIKNVLKAKEEVIEQIEKKWEDI